MKSFFAVALAAAGSAAAAPAACAASAPSPVPVAAPLHFGGLSLRSASPIHFANINANGQDFWIGKNASTYCPPESSACATVNNSTTIFSYLNGTLSLDTLVPGGQQVYVTAGNTTAGQLAGLLKFTQAHSTSTFGPALYDGFSVTYEGSIAKLQFEGKDWFACPVDKFNTGYGIVAISRTTGSNAGAGCLSFTFDVVQVNSSYPAAWQYQ
ncbi:Hypothetical predicted protein [Lecanosticta acicola]|uniref:Uncharacterized protein n=1 Tax=Lecanosticta acicola TaxID=111012 RepID=A0AAI8Z6L2_9PEZI|nr:Hypothetical predicted protein [Lecanosticta acicola]